MKTSEDEEFNKRCSKIIRQLRKHSRGGADFRECEERVAVMLLTVCYTLDQHNVLDIERLGMCLLDHKRGTEAELHDLHRTPQ